MGPRVRGEGGGAGEAAFLEGQLHARLQRCALPCSLANPGAPWPGLPAASTWDAADSSQNVLEHEAFPAPGRASAPALRGLLFSETPLVSAAPARTAPPWPSGDHLPAALRPGLPACARATTRVSDVR